MREDIKILSQQRNNGLKEGGIVARGVGPSKAKDLLELRSGITIIPGNLHFSEAKFQGKKPWFIYFEWFSNRQSFY
jgi:hypothetical protein